MRRLLMYGLVLLAGAARASTNFVPVAVEFTRVTAGPAGTVLEWNAPPGAGWLMEVESRDSLAGGAWAVAPNGGELATNRYVDPRPSAGERFYRLTPLALPAARGRVINTTLLKTYPRSELQLIFLFAGISVTPQSPVALHKVAYETVDPWGGRTTASGTVAVPVGVANPLPLVSYQHGTVLEDAELPSRQGTESLVGVVFATTGYAAVMPDYLGLGDSPGFHPYHHAKTHATATVDLLRAARTWASSNAVALNGRVFLTGYSQGGHATLAAHREIEALHRNEFNLVAVGAGAGAYDLAGVTAEAFTGTGVHPNPYYLPYFLLGLAAAYPADAAALRGMLAPPYRTTVPPLFDGLRDAGAINAALPAVPSAALDPAQLEAFRTDPGHFLRRLLRENSLLDWRPLAPLRLYHCGGDLDVSPANATRARDALAAAGAASVQVFDPRPSADHGDCAVPALLAVKTWFDSLR
ncbi:MAG: alpha/beta hydrolase family protein [Limisphaerales bacterium]